MKLLYCSGVWSYVVGALSTPTFIIIPLITIWAGIFPIVISWWAALGLTVYMLATMLVRRPSTGTTGTCANAMHSLCVQSHPQCPSALKLRAFPLLQGNNEFDWMSADKSTDTTCFLRPCRPTAQPALSEYVCSVAGVWGHRPLCQVISV